VNRTIVSKNFILVFVAALVLLSTLGRTAGAASILMVTNNNTTTQSLNDFLVNNGHTVTRGDFIGGIPDQATLDAHDLILVARETDSGQYDDGTEPQDWNGVAKPTINMAPHIMRSNRWGWIDGTSIPGQGDLTGFDPFPDANHPFLQGVGSPTIFTQATGITGADSDLPAAATTVATYAAGASHGIYVIPEGTTMFNGRGTAGDIRIGYIRGNEGSWDNISADGGQILLNMINSVAIPEPSSVVLAMLGLMGVGCLAYGRRRVRR